MSSNDQSAAPPASTGNAGAHFEARVGAYYSLCMIAGGEPRGLPGATVATVAFQRRFATHPLDDVVVFATNPDGTSATLEIQVKRSLTFSDSDAEFTDVVAQMWQASLKPEFGSQRYELAVAIAKTTTRIEKDVQEVLRWARAHLDHPTFFDALARKGFASEQMRSFVTSFRSKLGLAGGTTDDESVWLLLRRFQVMPFDFEASGSDYEHRARERAAAVLTAEQRARAGDLWTALIVDTEEATSAAGARDSATIKGQLVEESGFAFGTAPVLHNFMLALADGSRLAAQDIDDNIRGARLGRTDVTDAAFAGLETRKILNIQGAPGVGKSAVLKGLFETVAVEGRSVFLGSGRIVGGGWQHMAHQLGTNLPSPIVFNEIASGGGAWLFIDNVDQVDNEGQRATIRDLLNAVAEYPGWRAVVTSSLGNAEWRRLLPDKLSESVQTITVPELNDAQARELSAQNAALGAILAAGHPAQQIARNLFFLRRIAEMGDGSDTVSTELDLARLWWQYGAGRGEDGKFARLTALRRMAQDIWNNPSRASSRTDDLSPEVVEELLRLDAIREERRGAEVAFRHDVLRDWSVGFLLDEQPERLANASKTSPVASTVVRSLEVTARAALADDPTGAGWLAVLRSTEAEETHSSWRRPLLLAIVRSERSSEDLDTLSPVLFANDGRLLRELLRATLVMDSQSASEFFAELAPAVEFPKSARDFVVPRGRSWFPLVTWLVANSSRLPLAVVPEATNIFFSWLLAISRLPLDVNAQIVALLFDWLALVDEEMAPRSFRSLADVPESLGIENTRDAQQQLRMTAFAYANLNPAAARQYLDDINQRRVGYQEFQDIVKWRAGLASAAPHEFATFLLREMLPSAGDDDDVYGRERHGPFGVHDHLFSPPSPAQAGFLDILEASPDVGLRFVHMVVDHVANWHLSRVAEADRPAIEVPFPKGKQSFVGGGSSYLLARTGMPSAFAGSALLALETWAHRRIEAGSSPGEVLQQVLGPDGSSVAVVAVAVDLVLSHWTKLRDISWPLFAVPTILCLDSDRAARDSIGADRRGRLWTQSENDMALLDSLNRRASRRSQMTSALAYYTFHAPLEVRAALEDALRPVVIASVARASKDQDPVHGEAAVAKRTLRMLDRSNWSEVVLRSEDGSEGPYHQFVPEAEEQERLAERSRLIQVQAQHNETTAWLRLAFDDPKRSTPSRVIAAVEWARAQLRDGDGEDNPNDFATRMDRVAVVMAATVAARDYHEPDRAEVLSWARPVLDEAVLRPSRGGSFDNDQIPYDDAAVATVGLVALSGPDVDLAMRAGTLLPVAVASTAAVANALGSAFRMWPDDDILTRSLVRLLIMRAIYARRAFDEGETKGEEALAELVEAAVEDEQRWLAARGAEPPWPELPPWPITHLARPRIGGASSVPRRRRRSRSQVDLFVGEERLAGLLGHVFPLMIGKLPRWTVMLAEHLQDWTISANSGDEDRPDNDRRPYSWNGQFFHVLGVLCAALPKEQALERFVRPYLALPDDAFHDAAAGILRGFDIATFSTDAIKPTDVITIRREVAERIKTSRNFRNMAWRGGETSEMHGGDALTAMFFESSGLNPNRTPSFPVDWTELETVMPSLTDLTTSAPLSSYIATLFVDVLEAAPRSSVVGFAVDAIVAWAAAHGADSGFWVSRDLGTRIANWLADRLSEAPEAIPSNRRPAFVGAVDCMVRAGVSAARGLEERLSGAR